MSQLYILFQLSTFGIVPSGLAIPILPGLHFLSRLRSVADSSVASLKFGGKDVALKMDYCAMLCYVPLLHVLSRCVTLRGVTFCNVTEKMKGITVILAIGSNKGGVGKSTITTNLAVSFRKKGKDVIVIEADPTVRTSSNWRDDRDEGGHPPVTVVRQSGNLRDILLDLDKKYDLVLVDLAGKDSKEARTTAVTADLLLVPCQPSQADVDTTLEMADLVEEYGDFNPRLKVALVLNRVSTNPWDPDEKYARETLEENFGKVLRTSIHERKAYKALLREGLTAVEGSDLKAKGEITSLTDDIEELFNDHA